MVWVEKKRLSPRLRYWAQPPPVDAITVKVSSLALSVPMHASKCNEYGHLRVAFFELNSSPTVEVSSLPALAPNEYKRLFLEQNQVKVGRNFVEMYCSPLSALCCMQ